MLRTRAFLTTQEHTLLASYASLSSHTKGRTHPEQEPEYRLPYVEDRDRVLHTSAFRRLKHKTQVFVSSEGDYYRTRLTHTLEVAEVARMLCMALGLNEYLSETIALSHDLGHPPFGHAGENALDSVMQSIGAGYFEHNLQTMRIVTQLEQRSPEYAGLNLSLEVLEGISEHRASYNPLNTTLEQQPSLEAQLADIADSMAYYSHDLDDGLRSGVLTHLQVAEIPLWQDVAKDLNIDLLRMTAPQRKQMVQHLLHVLTEDVLLETEKRLKTAQIKTLADVQQAPEPLVGYSGAMAKAVSEVRSFFYETFYQHHHIVRQTFKAEQILSQLFKAYLKKPQMLPKDHYQRTLHSSLERVVCDYLAGMTDRYAEEEYRKIYAY